MDMIRCPGCRGAKKVPKLGGMIGRCNACAGKGEIKLSDKPAAVVIEPVDDVKEIVGQVANVAPCGVMEDVKEDFKVGTEFLRDNLPTPTPPKSIKESGKKAVYKHKKN